ncbi:MAG: 5-oxoprolinase subunit PxpB, partial [Burkholderiales bacterium]
EPSQAAIRSSPRTMNVRFLISGDTALVVEFGDRIDRALNDRVLRLSALLRTSGTPGIVETVPTYRSLMVLYDPLITDSENLIATIRKFLDHDDGAAATGSKLWRIPACYASSHAPDLTEVAQRTGLAVQDVIRRHVETCFHVYMIGFVPGFPYMGDLPEPLVLPRRTDPRVKVPAGSIAIATNMTAIYPVESPGGWHLIGTTPIRLFDMHAAQPALLSPGDKVRFESITAAEFDEIRAAVAADAYQLACEQVAA